MEPFVAETAHYLNVTFPSVDSVCLEFINSEWGDFRGRFREDCLLISAWREDFLRRWGLEVEAPATQEVLHELLALRELMRRVVASLEHGAPSQEDLEALNAALLKAPWIRRLDYAQPGFHLHSQPLAQAWNRVIGELALSFAELLVTRDPRRLKPCANPHCRWIFYDETRSRTRRYCHAEKCGNLVKLRRFRARHQREKTGTN